MHDECLLSFHRTSPGRALHIRHCPSRCCVNKAPLSPREVYRNRLNVNMRASAATQKDKHTVRCERKKKNMKSSKINSWKSYNWSNRQCKKKSMNTGDRRGNDFFKYFLSLVSFSRFLVEYLSCVIFCVWKCHVDWESSRLTFSSEIPWFTSKAIPLPCSAFARWTATRFTTDFTGHSSTPSADDGLMREREYNEKKRREIKVH